MNEYLLLYMIMIQHLILCNRDKLEYGYILISLLYLYFHPKRKPFYLSSFIPLLLYVLTKIITSNFRSNKIMYSAKWNSKCFDYQTIIFLPFRTIKFSHQSIPTPANPLLHQYFQSLTIHHLAFPKSSQKSLTSIDL